MQLSQTTKQFHNDHSSLLNNTEEILQHGPIKQSSWEIIKIVVLKDIGHLYLTVSV